MRHDTRSTPRLVRLVHRPSARLSGRSVAGGWLIAALALATPAHAQKASPPANVAAQAVGRLIGDYDTTIRTRFDPASPVRESYGYARIRPVAGGRFVLEENFGEQFGDAYQGVRLYGYNDGTQSFEATWAYTGASAILNLQGAPRSGSDAIDYAGAFVDEGKTRTPVRARLTPRADGFLVELLGRTPRGGEFVVVETTYARRTESAKDAPSAPLLAATLGEWDATIEYRNADGSRARGVARLQATPLADGTGVAHQYTTRLNGTPFTVLETFQAVAGGRGVIERHTDASTADVLVFTGALDPAAPTRAVMEGDQTTNGVVAKLRTHLNVTAPDRFEVMWTEVQGAAEGPPVVHVVATRRPPARP